MPEAVPVAPPTTVPSAAALRLARLSDAAAIAALYREARGGDRAKGVRDWLENGGALVLEDETGRLVSALMWREEGEGWRLDPLAMLEDYRGQGFGRWMMTRVEALAIRENVASLVLELAADRGDLLSYYMRMGYHQENAEEAGEAEGTVRLGKRVGGTWQIKGCA